MITAPPQRRGDPAPISPLRGAISVALSLTLWQPVLYWLVHIVTRKPRVLTTSSQWAEYMAMAVVLAAIAGAISYYAAPLPQRAWRRWWGGATVLLIGGLSIIQADLLPTSPWPLWLIVVLVVSAVCGALFCSVARAVWLSINSTDAH